jgi:polysaccharide export outer membrane protein
MFKENPVQIRSSARLQVRALFFAPALAALLALIWTPGHAQSNGTVLPQLGQQLQNQFGGLNLGAGTVQGQQPDMSTQTYAPVPRSAPKPPSRLEQILSARAGVKLQQFGYDQLGSGRSVTIAQTGAVPEDYVLGPGDQIIVTLRGQENSEFRVAVDRNGQVVLPRLSPIAAIGRSFGSFREDLAAAVHRAYVATDATVSLATVRQISVLVSGEVDNPGQRTLSGLSSVVDALLLSGGVRKTGSLRNIRIQRAGHQYTVDLYSVLTSRGGGSSLRLADGDRILVPALGRTVAVAGLVRQPGIYELPGRQSNLPVRTLLGLAGGQEVRGRYRLSVLRVRADGQRWSPCRAMPAQSATAKSFSSSSARTSPPARPPCRGPRGLRANTLSRAGPACRMSCARPVRWVQHLIHYSESSFGAIRTAICARLRHFPRSPS